MTVGELITLLKKLPQDSVVYYEQCYGASYTELFEAENVQLVVKEKTTYNAVLPKNSVYIV